MFKHQFGNPRLVNTIDREVALSYTNPNKNSNDVLELFYAQNPTIDISENQQLWEDYVATLDKMNRQVTVYLFEKVSRCVPNAKFDKLRRVFQWQFDYFQ